jgi:hypothetical protein
MTCFRASVAGAPGSESKEKDSHDSVARIPGSKTLLANIF